MYETMTHMGEILHFNWYNISANSMTNARLNISF